MHLSLHLIFLFPVGNRCENQQGKICFSLFVLVRMDTCYFCQGGKKKYTSKRRCFTYMSAGGSFSYSLSFSWHFEQGTGRYLYIIVYAEVYAYDKREASAHPCLFFFFVFPSSVFFFFWFKISPLLKCLLRDSLYTSVVRNVIRDYSYWCLSISLLLQNAFVLSGGGRGEGGRGRLEDRGREKAILRDQVKGWIDGAK